MIKADARIPDRQTSVFMVLRRNTDTTFPASHLIELKFNPLSDPSYGEISAAP